MSTSQLEQNSISLVVQLGWGNRVRMAVAQALKAIRKQNDRDRARRFHVHVLYITGHMAKGNRC